MMKNRNLMSARFVSLVLFVAAWLSAAALNAQAPCDRVGWVAGAIPGCGFRIIDLDNPELLHAVSGYDGLSVGQTIRFGSEPAALPAGCTYQGATTVALTCVSDTLPCTADFGHVTDQLNAFRIAFNADIYDASTQQCVWTFGDGATATGPAVEHTFAQEGAFQVCLTVSDAFGCSVQKCRTVYVTEQNPNWCGYDVHVTAVGNQLFGKVAPLSSDAGQLTSVLWYYQKTNEVLSESAEMQYQLPGEGNYLICAQYTVTNNDDGTSCTTTRCQQITVSSPACVNTMMADASSLCPPLYAPVCGCNGISYANECEAMASGVNTWWAGPCGTATAGVCAADLDFQLVSGDPATGYQIRFNNLSSGNYTFIQLDFGDGSPLWEGTQLDTITHLYAQEGVYRTNLTVWKNNTCISSVTKLLVTDSYHMHAAYLPDGTDYVMPGDADGNRRANVYDLLSLGVGYFAGGSPRPNASTEWAPQFAPNWPSAMNSGVNYKHLDCDGNGTVNVFDADAIEQHCTPIDSNKIDAAPGAPEVWVEFAQDTLVLDPQNPVSFVEISADVMIGSPTKPAIGLYGLAFALRYPDYFEHNPEVNYDDNSFFGFTNHLMWLPKDHYSRRQLDLGFVRTNGQTASGYGRIAKITAKTEFIIIVDITGRSATKVEPVTMRVGGLKAIDTYGNELELTPRAQLDTLWVKLMPTATSTDTPGSEWITIAPNPAVDHVSVYLGDLVAEEIAAVNMLGQSVYRAQPVPGDRIVRLPVAGWKSGVYSLQIRTASGMIEKRLMVR